MKKLLFSLLLLLPLQVLFAQDDFQKVITTPDVEYHQIYLDEPAKSIEHMEYDKDGAPIEGKLSKDGHRVLIKDYRGKSRVKVNVTYNSGRTEEIIKSSCYIDPVPPS